MDSEEIIVAFAGLIAVIGGLILAFGLFSYINGNPNSSLIIAGVIVFALGLVVLALLGYGDSK